MPPPNRKNKKKSNGKKTKKSNKNKRRKINRNKKYRPPICANNLPKIKGPKVKIKSDTHIVNSSSDDFDYFNDFDCFNDFNYFDNDFFFYPEVPEADPIPNVVLQARNGNLESIKKYIEAGADLDKRQKWTEVQQKLSGFCKSWEWFGNSALIEASQKEHIEIVQHLLLAGADPMLKSCWTDDCYHDALNAAITARNKRKNNMCNENIDKYDSIIAMLSSVNNLWTQLNPNCNETAHYKKHREKKIVPKSSDIQNAIKATFDLD